MYFPYLRGRQNELLCIKELLESGKLSDKIIPVIEPVRFNSTFFMTLAKFVEMKRKIIIIRNPQVGSYKKDYHDMIRKIAEEKNEKKKNNLQKKLDLYLSLELLTDENIIDGYISNGEIVDKILNGEKKSEEIVVINKKSGDYVYYEENGERLKAKITFIPNDEDFKDEVYGNVVMIKDCYNKAKKNVDYLNQPDEFFSRNHIVYAKRGYFGFSDYSIVGEEYDESGFAPSAIAIHIMYYGKNNELRIHHFVSDSNDTKSDLARKFEEAMSKLVSWEMYDEIPKTDGLNRLVECYYMGQYPGLGMIKRFSLMHHIQMMSEYLGDE